MNHKSILAFLLVGALVVSGCTQGPQANNPQAQPPANGVQNPIGGTVANNPTDTVSAGTFTIERKDTGFVPQMITVKKGSTVNFVNKTSGGQTWPASAKHPTHTVYPGSNIEKCGTPEEEGIFDACSGMNPGENFSFTFNEAGEWGFHDHLDATKSGKIIVTD